MKKTKILLIDDDKTLIELLSEHLKSVGYRVISANDGPTGLETAQTQQPDIIILDIMMPEMDGWEVCQRLREISSLPIIMLTAKGEEFDKLRGFQLGVDDYVTKPFSFAELSARVKAVTARAGRQPRSQPVLELGNLSINFDERRVQLNSTPLNLTPTEYKLIEALARSSQRTVPTETLLNQVWGNAYSGEIEHVKHYIWSLRKKIEEDPGNPQHIITERGFGYRLE